MTIELSSLNDGYSFHIYNHTDRCYMPIHYFIVASSVFAIIPVGRNSNLDLIVFSARMLLSGFAYHTRYEEIDQ